MKYILLFFVTVVFVGCAMNTGRERSAKTAGKAANSYVLTDTVVNFVWRKNVYEYELNDSINKLFVNTEYCKRIPNAEKAAVGYVATFIGNDCWWDGTAKDDRSNLDCTIISALGLGYQCSSQHLEFLRKWFANDEVVLQELADNNCPTVPYTATIQSTFTSITIEVKQDTIFVKYLAGAINTRSNEATDWEETDSFILNNNTLTLLKKDKKNVTTTKF